MWCTLHIMCICWTTFYNIYGLLNLVLPQNLPALCITILLLPYAFYMQQCYYHSAHLISAQHVTISNVHTTATTNTTISNAHVTIRNVCVSIITSMLPSEMNALLSQVHIQTPLLPPHIHGHPWQCCHATHASNNYIHTYIHAYIIKASTDFGSVCNI
jgi:hypothetical protein